MAIDEERDTPDEVRLRELLHAGAHCDRTGPLWREMLAFHDANRWVYGRLKQICFELRSRGFVRYSTRTIISVLRFESDLKTSGQNVRIDGGEERSVKLNNNHSPYYARMIIEEHPEFWEFFELRAAEGDPTEMPPPRPEPEPSTRQWFTTQLAFL